MSARIVGIDMDGDDARIVEGRARKGVFEIHQAALVPASDVGEALKGMGLKGAAVYVGVTGRDMILRTTQVPPVPEWQLAELMEFEIQDVAEQSGDDLSADFELLPGAARWSDEDLVLLALVRDTLIEERGGLLAEDGIKVRAFTPNAVALHNAYFATQDPEGTVMVACLGESNTDIALVHEGDLLFARNLAGGGDLFTDAVAAAFDVTEAKAAVVKRRLGQLARPGEKLAGQQAAVARALEPALRKVTGMLQSSVMLCRNQLKATDMRLDRVLLCGPGAALPGLDEALTRAMDVPVERFDPSEGYVVGEADVLDDRGADFAVATGLAMMGALKDSYRVEILSEVEKKRRRFTEKTLWLVLAAVLVLGHLGYHAVVSEGRYSDARMDLVRLRREVETRLADTRNHERTLEEVSVLAARLSGVEQVTAPGSGVLTVLDLLAAHLPDELWVTSVHTVREAQPEFGHGAERRPYVVVEGQGKEISRNLADAVTELTTRLRAEGAVAAVLPRFTTDSRRGFTFDLRLDLSLFPAAEGDEEPDPPGGPQ